MSVQKQRSLPVTIDVQDRPAKKRRRGPRRQEERHEPVDEDDSTPADPVAGLKLMLVFLLPLLALFVWAGWTS